nr:hypothetical protein [Tanacetum cinerariifolium]
MFDVNDLHGEEVFVEKEVADKEVSAAGEVNAASIATTVNVAVTITTEEITLAQALVEIKTSKRKVKGIVLQEPSESTTITKTISLKLSQDNGKGIMVEEPVKLKKKDQIRLDEEAALKLQIDADYQMAERLQAEEQQELNDEEKATLFMQFLEKRRKFFAAKRAEEKRNKPPKQAQKKKIIVNTFEDFRIELVQGQDKEKRAREELTQESAKKQKVDDDKETAELKPLMKIILDEEEVAIDAIPLVVKSPKIID